MKAKSFIKLIAICSITLTSSICLANNESVPLCKFNQPLEASCFLGVFKQPNGAYGALGGASFGSTCYHDPACSPPHQPSPYPAMNAQSH